jgi:hypothetical protein
MIEQRDQRSKSTFNPKAIRKVYKKMLVDSVKEALENAYMDQKAVKDYLSTTEDELQEEYRIKRAQVDHARHRGSVFRPRRVDPVGRIIEQNQDSFDDCDAFSVGSSSSGYKSLLSSSFKSSPF